MDIRGNGLVAGAGNVARIQKTARAAYLVPDLAQSGLHQQFLSTAPPQDTAVNTQLPVSYQ